MNRSQLIWENSDLEEEIQGHRNGNNLGTFEEQKDIRYHNRE